ncbi:LysR family transcriptional regulator [Pseudomonas mandelii]|uniref:LysR family transcriptional regulator n=1 Tax=Pseudomonas mandelii TaxID=75612 RepID=A0A502IEJ2_9PSED|nr:MULTISPECIES: LysR family transcriptional regulator [Pseudomonas]TPG84016.1 LysR family transcriptional regulator [Pseudomonas mandelii]TPG93082.1 LysR family transcriptional regulator [Pseudomonas caspiana]
MIGNLSLDQLRILVTIADTGSFSATGRHLRRAQSAISQSIATLESVQGVRLFDRSGHRPTLTEVGRVLVVQARAVLASAAQFEAMAASTAAGVEPELALAIDPLVPSAPLIESLRAIREAFPHLAVSFSTEGLGGAERRLRNGDAALALCTLIPTVPDDVTALPLLSVDLRPVVASGHPLAMLGRRATSADLKPYVQLVLSDPVSPDGPSYGVTGSYQWRFVDLARRLDFLLAGFGWCRMPEHLIADHLASGRLVPLELTAELQRTPDTLTIYAAHMQNRSLGKAGRWLLNDLTRRLCM